MIQNYYKDFVNQSASNSLNYKYDFVCRELFNEVNIKGIEYYVIPNKNTFIHYYKVSLFNYNEYNIYL